MSYTIHQSQAAMKACFNFQRHADLADVRMVSGEFSALDQPEGSFGELCLDLELDPQVQSQGSVTKFLIGLSVVGSAPNHPAANPPLLLIRAKFLLTYSLRESYSPTEEELDSFKSANAVFNCWPYFREFVQSCGNRIGLRIAPLPLLRLAPVPQERSKIEKGEQKSGDGQA